jgi:BASS family bile acid:Na+ symporter
VTAAPRSSPLLLATNRLLGGLGRQATWFLAAGIFLGVAVPPLAGLARPLLTPAIFLLMLVTLLRIEPASLRAAFRRPWLLGLTVAWTLLAMPVGLWLVWRLTGTAGFFADHLLLTAASAPIASAAAYALLLGLDAAFALAVCVLATSLVPFTLPLLAALLLGIDLPLSPVDLWLRLLLLIGGAGLLATLVRRRAGAAWVKERAPVFDGLVVVAMVAFGLAVMDGVTIKAIADPSFVVFCVVATFGLAIVGMIVGTLLFAWLERTTALTIGLLSAFSNFGVVVAAMATDAPTATVIYLGIAQFPIYLLPLAMKPVVMRLHPPRGPSR